MTIPGIGCIAGNDPAGYTRFSALLGSKPTYALLAFNQDSPAGLWGSVGYICGQAKAFMRLGATIIWSVPCPGAGQLEAITAGTWSAQYTALFKAILAASPAAGTIYVRLPWEFNLPGQQNAAIDKTGKWHPNVFIAAWRVLAQLCHGVSARFQIIWCPNVCTQAVDPALCWPGMPYVDIIAQDFYMQSACNKPGDFAWFRDEARGLNWAVGFAKLKGKAFFGLSEWGMNSDAFVGDFNAAAAWLKALGADVHHHCWWDRADVIDCRISDGTHPGLAAAYKAKFA